MLIMKNKYIYIVSFMLTSLTIACDETPFGAEGKGNVILNTTINSNMSVVTRSDNDLKESCLVWISNEEGLVRKYQGDNIPAEPIPLFSGSYVAEAWAGDSISASFDHIWYKGQTKFEVESNKTTNVKLECKIANVAVEIVYEKNIPEVLKDYYMTVGHKAGYLEFKDEDADKTGYFMMPSYDKDLTYELFGQQLDGTEVTLTGKIENAQPTTKYILTVKCEEKTNEVGGAVFTIKIDEEEIELTKDIEVVAAPKIQGYDFDINSTIFAQEKQVGRKTVYVSSATKVTNLILECEEFKNIDGLEGYTDVDFLKMKDDVKDVLFAKGIRYEEKTNIPQDQSLIQINLEDFFTNSLKNGKYVFNLTAKDINGRTSNATINLVISDALVTPSDKEPVIGGYHSAIIYGQVAKEGVESVGFNYRLKNSSTWEHIEGIIGTRSIAVNTEFYAELTDLKAGKEYEYVVTADDFVSTDINTFKTQAYPQLPNSSFEDWFLYNKKVWVPGTDYTNNFWDTGNHGSTTLGESYNLTTQNTQYKHSGKSSICLKSKFIIVKFGAGNVFLGKYLDTDGTDGVLGLGQPFEFPAKVKSVKMWVKYIPTQVTSKTAGNNLKAGDMDQGQIYIALTDNTTDSYNGESWPYVVKTKKSNQKLFNPEDPRVIAYGEHTFTAATSGNGLIEIEIPLDYRRNDVTPVNIIFTASASKFGDYFEGGDGSTMYLDDIELIYED